MNRNITTLVEEVEIAQERLEEAIFNRMDEIAREEDLDTMCFTHFGNSYTRNYEGVHLPELDNLEDIYLNNIHEGGFEAVWQAHEGGWL